MFARHRRVRTGSTCRLGVESLESRCTPAFFIVNDSGDAPDATPGDGIAETAAGNNKTTLRAAIQEGNALGGQITIDIPPETPAPPPIMDPSGATMPPMMGPIPDPQPRTIALGSALPVLTANFGIIGLYGAGRPTITRTAGAAQFRIFEVDWDSSTDLTYLQITNGSLTGKAADDGGGVLNNGTLSIMDSVIRGNAARNGGGVMSSGRLNVFDTDVWDNTATAVGGSGGVVYIDCGADPPYARSPVGASLTTNPLTPVGASISSTGRSRSWALRFRATRRPATGAGCRRSIC